MHAELIAFGVVPEEELPEPADTGEVKEPLVPTDRQAAIFVAFEKVILRGKRGEFSGTGSPHVAVMSKELGWSLDAKERDSVWQEFQAREFTA